MVPVGRAASCGCARRLVVPATRVKERGRGEEEGARGSKGREGCSGEASDKASRRAAEWSSGRARGVRGREGRGQVSKAAGSGGKASVEARRRGHHGALTWRRRRPSPCRAALRPPRASPAHHRQDAFVLVGHTGAAIPGRGAAGLGSAPQQQGASMQGRCHIERNDDGQGNAGPPPPPTPPTPTHLHATQLCLLVFQAQLLLVPRAVVVQNDEITVLRVAGGGRRVKTRCVAAAVLRRHTPTGGSPPSSPRNTTTQRGQHSERKRPQTAELRVRHPHPGAPAR